jgi:uncharacterized protein YdbL (DUF1318 family)
MNASILPRFLACLALLAVALLPQVAAGQANLDIDTPAITATRNAMAARYPQLEPFFASGAVGLTRDGMVAVRDANAVPLNQRAAVNALVSQENQDRAALYREIARANGHPEWEADIRNTFARRWIDRARPGWWYQNAAGVWTKR